LIKYSSRVEKAFTVIILKTYKKLCTEYSDTSGNLNMTKKRIVI